MIKEDKFDTTEEEGLREARWLIVKAMLDEYPELRKRVRKYLERCAPSIISYTLT